MEIKSRIFEKYDNYQLCIPLNQGDRVIAKGVVKVGGKFVEKAKSISRKTLYLPNLLICKKSDCERYLVSIDGEYVEEGELIAQKRYSRGLKTIDIYSPGSGVLNLSRIKQGYIDILEEEEKVLIRSDFESKVERVDPSSGIVIKTNVIAIEGVVSSKVDTNLFGKLEVLGDGNTILTKANLDYDYKDKILWVGPYLHDNVAVELFERGAQALVTYSMSYEKFRDIGLPIMLLGGFGTIHCDSKFIKKFISFKNNFVVFDTNQNKLFVLSDIQMSNSEWFVSQYVNQSVLSRSPSSYGYIGKVLEHEQDSVFLLVDFNKKGTSLIHMGLLDFVDL
jgi:hypothetical protein